VYIKAVLICEDVRLEASGALTLVGVINERLIAPRDEGPLVLPRLVFVVVAAGLYGIDQIGYRQYVRRVDGPEPERAGALHAEPHHPETDEHNFIFGPIAMTVQQPGTYELVVELQARGESLVHRYRFHLERAA
jgi:hypothetical protein